MNLNYYLLLNYLLFTNIWTYITYIWTFLWSVMFVTFVYQIYSCVLSFSLMISLTYLYSNLLAKRMMLPFSILFAIIIREINQYIPKSVCCGYSGISILVGTISNKSIKIINYTKTTFIYFVQIIKILIPDKI